MAVLDETGPDVDSNTLSAAANGVQTIRAERPALGTLAITDHLRLLDHFQPDVVHVLIDGQVVATGGREFTVRLENDGYESFR